jgi:hypothetical protein
MPGGKLHWPLWVPYELYGTIDYVYGWPAWEAKSGFTGAQGMLNAVETAMYLVYLGIVIRFGVQSSGQGVGAPDKGWIGKLGMSREIAGREAAIAVLIAYSAAVMTVSKTVLYCKFLGSVVLLLGLFLAWQNVRFCHVLKVLV